MKGSRKKATQPEAADTDYDWGPFTDELRARLEERGYTPEQMAGMTTVQATVAAEVFTGQVPVTEKDGLMVAEEPKKFPWEEALPVEPPGGSA
jgi:hypothetical protein